jgi:hypothetical protein
MIIIGIDPDLKKSGVAVFDTEAPTHFGLIGLECQRFLK